MNGRCPQRQAIHCVRVRRGDKISNYQCPECRVPLQGVAAGRGRGRYLCPIDAGVVTLGQTGVELDRPMRLVWRPASSAGTTSPSPASSTRRAWSVWLAQS
ncbi:hypothetical protein Scel_85700 [Streptomyces cellostaticus]|nr:hypothetical protein Scel_85700 [Streptomyces cellostaticus]